MFQSSKTSELASLQEYVDRMKEGQTQIYYLAGENLDVVSSSPLLERLIKKGFEVLYMTDPIDEYAMGNLEKFDGKYKLTNIARYARV
jgi:HSP90 family molecular chaperone